MMVTITPRRGHGCDQDWPSFNDIVVPVTIQAGDWHSHAVWWKPSTWGTGHLVDFLEREVDELAPHPCRCCGGHHPYEHQQAVA